MLVMVFLWVTVQLVCDRHAAWVLKWGHFYLCEWAHTHKRLTLHTGREFMTCSRKAVQSMQTKANTCNIYKNKRKLLTFSTSSTSTPVLCPSYILWMKKMGQRFLQLLLQPATISQLSVDCSHHHEFFCCQSVLIFFYRLVKKPHWD